MTSETNNNNAASSNGGQLPPSGLPASWFTTPIPARSTTDRQQYSQEFRERVSRVTQRGQNYVSQLNEPGRDWPRSFVGQNTRFFQQAATPSRNTISLAGAGLESGVGIARPAGGNSNFMPANMVDADNDVDLLHDEQVMSYLPPSAEERRLFESFQAEARSVFRRSIETIGRRKSLLLQSFEADNLKLQQLQSGQVQWSGDANDPESENRYISRLSKVQRIRLRAVEMETLNMQRLRGNFQVTMQQFKIEVQRYLVAKARGEYLRNPVEYFKPQLIDWDPHKNMGIKIALMENHMDESDWDRLRLMVESDPPENTNTRPRAQAQHIHESIVRAPFTNGYNNININSRVATTAISTTTNLSFPYIFPLQELPQEILSLVLEMVGQKTDIVLLLTVCKAWAAIIVKLLYYRPHINKKPQLDLFMNTMRKPASELVFDYRPMIKRLNFSFVGDYMTDAQLLHFVGCPNLERLTLVFCKQVTTKSIAKVLKGCRFLQSVDITGVREVGNELFNVLSTDCKRIQGLYVPRADLVSCEAIEQFVENAPMLKRVKITFNKNITNNLLIKMAHSCPLLVEVDLTSTPQINNDSIVTLMTELPQLREFRLTQNMLLSDAFATQLALNVTSLPALRLVDLSACESITDKTVVKLVQLAPKLRNVYLGKCSRITDNSLIALSKLGKNLQTVHFGHCFNITDEGVKVLIQNCPRIQYVDFACCTNLTNHTLYELGDLTKLKRIGLVKCSQMTDEGLLNMIALRGRNDTLERVHLSYCTNLTIYPIYELVMACPKLSHLSLTAVPSFLRPDITQFCRPPPSEFTVNQRQIFCVFSGKGVQKLRHHLMSMTRPTDGPTTKVRKILIEFLIARGLFKPNENEEEALKRIADDINQESAALMTASSMFNAANEPFQSINFERIDELFTFLKRVPQDDSVSSEDLAELMPLVDESFCEEPFRSEWRDHDGIVAPRASNDLNSELADIVRKFHALNDRIADFEVNVSSIIRIQFQYTGSMLAEMSHIYMLLVDLNRTICDIQKRIYEINNPRDVKAITIWRMLWTPRFEEMLRKYKLDTVVLRLYLKNNVAVLTRQREVALLRARTLWDTEQSGLVQGNGAVNGNTVASDPSVVAARQLFPQFQIPVFRPTQDGPPPDQDDDEVLEES
ncbi:AER398Wp [Eremothecium gossypii ATCC 10895]|uniref:AER398Wp n=1 Tax=Eremothecium gossypii (strain ATCC 10895 / CBS 109.51 / FGSC 9923 / NRRL Y-1056) TaxID=284811 RepID=Q755X0_EREGS|nr:AER398Wp [Eremothecium gossypii ATCC 10895]AAS53077.1 AER398Wp [Eremothecium gossypii ATCC 10895]AEY97386.1 FAER398Wp [Eremothecium gossypii FDAG1]